MARSGRKALGWVAVSATLAVACNAISGLDEDYRLADNSALPGEAGTETSSGSSGTSNNPDGSPADVVTADVVDATLDANDSGSWCPPGAIFCENWDDQTTTWTRQETVGGAWTIEAGQGIGGSKALKAHADSVATSRKVVRWKTIASTFPSGTRYTLTFKFRLANVGVDYAVVGAIQANNTQQSNTEYGVAVYKNCPGPGPALCLDESNPAEEGSPHPFVGQIAYQTTVWHRAEISVVRNAGNYVGTVKVDDQALDTNGVTYFGTPSAPTIVEVGVGLFFTGNDLGASDFYVDEIAAVSVP